MLFFKQRSAKAREGKVCSFLKGRFLQIFKKVLIFKVPVIFENKNFFAHAHGKIRRFFGIEHIKI